MNITFSNPPLIEIIAEVKWGLPDKNGIMAPIMPNSPDTQDAFVKFTAQAGALGYTNTERLIPPDFPMMPYDPAIRFRPSIEDSNKKPTLYQIGPNIFTANAIPPYKSWEDFSPIVSDGVNALIKSWGSSKVENINTSLRYIDVFQKNLTHNKETIDFLADTLGIKIELPEVIKSKFIDKISPSLQIAAPIKLGLMSMRFGKGFFNEEEATIVDISILTNEPLSQTNAAIMDSFNSARTIMHNIFVGITRPIHELMGIEGGAA